MMRERNVGSVVLIEEHRPVAIWGTESGAEKQVEEAAELMVRHGVRRLVIVDGERLIGILTLDDIASRTGDHELASQLSARVTRAVMPDFFFHERGDH